jgi:hypothetical protein
MSVVKKVFDQTTWTQHQRRRNKTPTPGSVIVSGRQRDALGDVVLQVVEHLLDDPLPLRLTAVLELPALGEHGGHEMTEEPLGRRLTKLPALERLLGTRK